MRGSLTLLAAAAVLSLAAYGEDIKPTVPAAAASSEQTADLDQVVCKRLPPLVGSRLGGRTECQTKKQWLALEKDTQDVLSKLQNGANQPTGPGK